LVCLLAGLRKNYKTDFSQKSVESWHTTPDYLQNITISSVVHVLPFLRVFKMGQVVKFLEVL